MMTAFMQAAPTTEITFDLYSKLCSLSSKFKELFNKGNTEGPRTAYASNGASGTSGSAQNYSQDSTNNIQAGQNVLKAKFCGSCGAKM